MRSLSDIYDEYAFLDADERYRLLIELGRELDDMPQALKTDATLVPLVGVEDRVLFEDVGEAAHGAGL